MFGLLKITDKNLAYQVTLDFLISAIPIDEQLDFCNNVQKGEYDIWVIHGKGFMATRITENNELELTAIYGSRVLTIQGIETIKLLAKRENCSSLIVATKNPTIRRFFQRNDFKYVERVGNLTLYRLEVNK